MTPLGGLHRSIAVKFGIEKLEWRGYSAVRKFEDMSSRFDRIPASDRRTERQTNTQTDRHLAMA